MLRLRGVQRQLGLDAKEVLVWTWSKSMDSSNSVLPDRRTQQHNASTSTSDSGSTGNKGTHVRKTQDNRSGKSSPPTHERSRSRAAEMSSKDGSAQIFCSATDSQSLAQGDVNGYYPLDELAIPEAFEQWFTNRARKIPKRTGSEGGASVMPIPKFAAGCKGLQAEFAQSWYPYLMHRSISEQLWQRISSGKQALPEISELSSTDNTAVVEESSASPSLPSERPGNRILVQGGPGSGKSVLMAATVERMRKNDWIVMYVPDVSDITTKSKFYSQNPETGMYDTRDSAQNILRSMQEAHSDQLGALPQQLPGGSGTLLDLCTAGESGTDASICAAAVRLKLELYRLPASQRSAVVLDNYNALYWKTPFAEFKSINEAPRPLDAQEMTLAANLRILGDQDVGNTTVIAAISTSGEVPRIEMTDVDYRSYTALTVPLFSVEELGKMMCYYRYVHAISPTQEITPKGIAAAHQLTQGNGNDVRKNLHFLLPYDPSLEDMDKIGTTYAGQSLSQS